MAAVLASAVTINDVWYTADTGRQLKVVDATIVLSSQGGLTNSIGAALFGMNRVRGTVGPGVDSVGSLAYPLAPSYDRTLLCVYDLTNATDATRATPADITKTIRVIVQGTE